MILLAGYLACDLAGIAQMPGSNHEEHREYETNQEGRCAKLW